MLYMNDYDIEMARRLARREDAPVIAAGVEILDRLRDWTDRNSDGWAYWRKPVQAASKLMTLIQDWEESARDWRGGADDVSGAQLQATLRPIKSFLTRQGVAAEERRWILEGVRG